MQGEAGFSEKKMPASPCTPSTQKNFGKEEKETVYDIRFLRMLSSALNQPAFKNSNPFGWSF